MEVSLCVVQTRAAKLAKVRAASVADGILPATSTTTLRLVRSIIVASVAGAGAGVCQSHLWQQLQQQAVRAPTAAVQARAYHCSVVLIVAEHATVIHFFTLPSELTKDFQVQLQQRIVLQHKMRQKLVHEVGIRVIQVQCILVLRCDAHWVRL